MESLNDMRNVSIARIVRELRDYPEDWWIWLAILVMGGLWYAFFRPFFALFISIAT